MAENHEINLKNLPDFAFITDEKLTILATNTNEKLLGKPLQTVVQTQESITVSTGKNKPLLKENTTALATIFKKPIPVLLSAHQLTKKPITLLFLAKDISQFQREMETITEKRNKDKSKFLANMTHELCTPLNAIIGISELILEDIENSSKKEIVNSLSRINKAGKRLLELIRAIVELSRIEAGIIKLENEKIDIDNLITELEQVIKSLAKINNNEIIFEYNKEMKTIYTDSKQLHKILMSVLSNACKSTRDDKIKLTLKKEKRNAEEWIIFTVRDNGAGMSEEESEKIFEKFIPARNTTEKFNEVETGLGLALCKKICLALGGDIQVKSKKGEGSVFTIKLPEKL